MPWENLFPARLRVPLAKHFIKIYGNELFNLPGTTETMDATHRDVARHSIPQLHRICGIPVEIYNFRNAAHYIYPP